ncbi:MAG: hypothetical protein IJJ98_02195 [Prevotella sp.]|nr:hypothetical protein [Prevotella sp.]
MIDNILLHQSNALDAQDDVFRLIKRELLKDEGIQIDKKSAALYIRKVLLYREERYCFIEKKGAALYINKVYHLGECARGLYKKRINSFAVCRLFAIFAT